jgi:hypothetical protein
MRRFLRKRWGCFAAILLTCSFSLLSTTGSAGVWDVTGPNPITILAHSPTIDGFPIENMFGATSQHPTFGAVDHTIFSDASGDAGYIDYVEWRTSVPIDLPGFSLYANKDGSTSNRMFTWFNLYYSENSGTTWVRFYTKNVVNDYAHGYLNINVPSSSFIRPVSGKQYFRAEFVRGGDDPFIDGPRVIELDAWPIFTYIEVVSDYRSKGGWRLQTDFEVPCRLPPSATIAYSVDGGGFNTMSLIGDPFLGYKYIYQAWVTDQLGGSPLDYNGSTFVWIVDDPAVPANYLSASATLTSGIRQVPLSTDFTISGNPAHPTISWHNPDPLLDSYTVRVIVDGEWIWQDGLSYSSHGANPTYTISGFTFEPGVEYQIRIEAREWLSFPFNEGSDIPPSGFTISFT